MKLGLFYELQMPRPWKEEGEQELLEQSLEQIAIADRLGYDSAWAVEHHFLEEYAHSSAPEVFLAAASQRTRTIRLGHGIVLLPPPYNHPARVAERIAMLDLVSNGRVEFGGGESSSEVELGGFRIARAQKREMWQEALAVICRMFVEQPFSGHAGAHFEMPARNIVPKPVQKPHPPLWVACSQRETIRLAARLGIGALSFAFVTPDEARQWVDDYYATLAHECVPIGQVINPNVAIVLPMMCAATDPRAHQAGDDGFNFFAYALGHYYVFGNHTPGVTNICEEFRSNPAAAGFSPGSRAGCVGSPATIRETLRAYEQAGVDQVIFVSQAGTNRHEDICSSLEMFGREVLPEMKEREVRLAASKASRLAPSIDAALVRKPAPPPVEKPAAVRAGAGGLF